MADDHKKNDSGWSDLHNAEGERELDAALANYAAVEPRAGLDGRILANLRTESVRAPDRAWWRWSMPAAIAAIVVVAAALAWRSSKPTSDVTSHPSPTTRGPQKPRTQVVSKRDGVPPRAAHTAQRRRHRSNPSLVVAAVPKLDQFPSPHPLSEQEKLLDGYVAQFHDQAVFVAQTQSEALLRDQEEDRKWGASRNGDSQQQNK
jgi:hypothetical protein